MHIAHPLWLLVALLGAAALYLSYRHLDRQRVGLLGSFASSRLLTQLTQSVSLRRVWIKRLALLSAVVCVCVALARPQGSYTTEVSHRNGLDILVAIDTSRSMLTPDVKPNRLARAKLAAEDLLDDLHGDGVGLVAFAGDAFLQAPITTDYEAYRDAVEALDTATIPRGGTNIAAAIRVAQATFKSRSDSDKILILMTDGEDLDAQGIAAARAAGKQGMKIFTVGVGTAAGNLIPVPDPNGGTDYLKDQSGEPVRSHLDAATLQQIAQATGGLYVPLGDHGQGVAQIYSQGLASFTRHDLAEQRVRVYNEVFQWPLLAGIALLILDSLLSTRRRSPKRAAAPAARHPAAGFAKLIAPVALLALGMTLMGIPSPAHASASDAEQAYRRGQFARAAQEYTASAHQHPTEAKLQFNLGAAAYKTKDFKNAARAFQSAIKSGAPGVQQSAYYNLGNTEYRVGEGTRRDQPQATIAQWQAAVKSYDAALQLQPGDADATFNRDVVRRELAQLQQQQQQQQKQQKQQDQKQDSKQAPQPQGGGTGQPDPKSKGKGDGNEQGKNTAQNSRPHQDTKQNSGSGAGAGQPTNPAQQPPHGAPQPNDAQQPGAATVSQGLQANRSEPQREKALPGELTPEEASQLMDSLKGDDHRFSAASSGLNADTNADAPPQKDW